MNRKLRTQIPVFSTELQCKYVSKMFVGLLNNSQNISKSWCDKTAQNLLYIWFKCAIIDTGKWEPGKIVEVCTEPRSYIVEDSHCKLLRRKKYF